MMSIGVHFFWPSEREREVPSFLQLFGQQITMSMYLFFLPFFLFILFIFKWFSKTTSSSNKLNLPPSPPKLPILGNIHQLGSYPHRSLHSLSQNHGHQLMLLHLGTKPALVVSSASAAREIMKTHDLIFSNRPKSSITERLLYNYNDVSSAPYGEYWRQMRSICVLQLLSNKRVQSFRAVREEETDFVVKEIEQSCSSSSPIDLSEKFVLVANNVVCRVALGRTYGGREFKELLGEFAGLLGSFNVGEFIPWLGWVNWVTGLDAKVNKVAKELDSFLDKVVEEHMEDGLRGESGVGKGYVDGEKQKDFVDVLLEVQKDSSLGFSIGRVSIKALILDMFAAGTDTTYTVLEWAMTELLKHPEVMNKLQNEVRGIARDNKSDMITEDDIEKMSYLKAVFKETLRLHPPIPLLVPRESTQDIKVMGYDIAAGTLVISNAWAIGRDPESWDEPNEFRPERFLECSVDFKGRDFQLIPFGAGRRGCPGIIFAMAVNELALAKLVHKFDWALPGGENGQDLDMTEVTGLTIHRKSPLLAIATPCSW